jgi:hypothetical protein
VFIKGNQGFFLMSTSVVPHKNVTKVLWYILVQLSSLNNTMSLVSGVSAAAGLKSGQSNLKRNFVLG